MLRKKERAERVLFLPPRKKNDTPSAGDEDLTLKNSLKHNRKRIRLKKKIPLISSLQEDIVEKRKLLTERLLSLQNYFFLESSL